MSNFISTTFFTGIGNVDFPTTSYSGDRFLDTYFLTTDRQKIDSLVSPYSSAIGSVEYGYLRSVVPAVIYRNFDIEVHGDELVTALSKQIIEDLQAVQGFLYGLWLAKDNAAFQDRGWLVAKVAPSPVVHTNTWETRNTLATGADKPTNFSTEELRRVRTGVGVDFRGEHIRSVTGPTMLTYKSLRFQRFMYFVQGARAGADVAIKLALYCSALEALVSTSQAELSHQVAERVSALIRERGPERVELFRMLKEAYGYRSKAVHGASFKGGTFDRLAETSKAVDQVCRDLSHLYLARETGLSVALEGASDALDSYFLNKIIGSD